MAQRLSWTVFLGGLAVCYAAPTVAPTDTPSDRDLAEVKHQTTKQTSKCSWAHSIPIIGLEGIKLYDRLSEE